MCELFLTQSLCREDDLFDSVALFRHGLLGLMLKGWDFEGMWLNGLRFEAQGDIADFSAFIVEVSEFAILMDKPGSRGGSLGVGSSLSESRYVIVANGLFPSIGRLNVDRDELNKVVSLSFLDPLPLSRFLYFNIDRVNGTSFNARVRITLAILNDRTTASPVSGVFMGTFSLVNVVEEMLYNLHSIGMPTMDDVQMSTPPSRVADSAVVSREYRLRIPASAGTEEALLRSVTKGVYGTGRAICFMTDFGLGAKVYVSSSSKAFSDVLLALTDAGTGAWDSIHNQVRKYVKRRVRGDTMLSEDFRAVFLRKHNMLSFDLPRGGRMRLMLSTFFLNPVESLLKSIKIQQSILSYGLLSMMGVEKPSIFLDMSREGEFSRLESNRLQLSDPVIRIREHPMMVGGMMLDYLEYALTIVYAIEVRNESTTVLGLDVGEVAFHMLAAQARPYAGRYIINQLFKSARRTFYPSDDEGEDADERAAKEWMLKPKGEPNVAAPVAKASTPQVSAKILRWTQGVSELGKGGLWADDSDDEEEEEDDDDDYIRDFENYRPPEDKISSHLATEGGGKTSVSREFVMSFMVAIFVRLNAF